MSTDKLFIPFTAAVVGLLLFNVWLNWPAGEPPRTVRCPHCGRDQEEGKDCVRCRTGKGRLPGRLNDAAARATGRTATTVTVVALTALLLGAFLFLRSRSQPAEDNAPSYLRCHCTKCNRRLRYTPQPFPRKILCPGCRSQVDVPATAPTS